MKTDMNLPNFSLGWELEATERSRRMVDGVQIDHDGSVNGDALEYRISRKIVYDPQQSLAALRQLATDPALRTDGSCGFHVHIGLGKRSKRLHQWAAAFITLARHVEKEAFAAVPENRKLSSYCKSWEESRGSIITPNYVRNKHSCQNRYNWVNPVEIFRPGGIRTIEVRLMGNSHRYPYLLSWVSFCRIMAASAWRVSLDISIEQEEIDTLKDVLETISRTFKFPCAPRIVAVNSIALAKRAGLIHPYGNVLEKIARTEKEMQMESILAEREKEAYRNLLDEMRQSIRRNVERLGDNPPHDGRFVVGDTVECVCVPVDGNLTRGKLYRVIEYSGNIKVIGDNGQPWWVKKNCVIFVERHSDISQLVGSA